MKVLVTGATGFLGKYVVEELAEQGYQVRAFGRNLKAGRQLEGPSVEFLLVILPEKKKFLQPAKEWMQWCMLVLSQRFGDPGSSFIRLMW